MTESSASTRETNSSGFTCKVENIASYLEEASMDDKADLIAKNEALIAENSSLNAQLTRALKLASEVEALHMKNRELSAKLSESEQQNEIVANRNQILTKKCQELTVAVQSKEGQISELMNCRAELEKQLKIAFEDQSHMIKSKHEDSVYVQSLISQFSTVVGKAVHSKEEFFDLALEAGKAMAESAKIKEETTSQTQTMKDMSSQLTKTRSLKEKVEIQLNELQKKYKDLSESTSSKISEQTEKIQLLSELNENLKDENTSLSEKIKFTVFNFEKKIEIIEYENQKLKESLNNSEQRVQNLRQRLELPVYQPSTELNQLLNEISELKSQNSELHDMIILNKTRTAKIESELAEKDRQLREMTEIRAKTKSKLLQAVKLIQTSEQNLLNEQKQSKQLKEQLKSTESQIQKLEASLKELQAEKNSLQRHQSENTKQGQSVSNAVSVLEASISKQQREIERLTNDRITLVKYTQRLLQLIDFKVPTITKQAVVSNEEPLQIIKQFLIPQLRGDLAERVNSISNNSSVSASKRVRDVYVELAEALTAKKQTAAPSKDDKTTPVVQQVFVLLQKMNEANILNDQLRDFIREQADFLKEFQFSLKPSDLSSENIQKFCEMHVMAVSILGRRLFELNAVCNEKSEAIQKVVDFYGCNSMVEVIENTKKLLKRVNELKTERRSIKASLTQRESTLNDRTAEIEDLTSKLQEMQTKLAALKDLYESSKTESLNSMNELSKCRELYEKKLEELNQAKETMSTELSLSEKQIDELRTECRDLSLKLSRITTDSESSKKILNATIEKLKSDYQISEEAYKNKLKEIEKAKRSSEEKLVRKIKSVQNFKKDEFERLVKIQKELELSLKEALTNLKRKSEETSQMQNQVLNYSEQIESLKRERQELSTSKKTIELQVRSLQEQLKREKMLLESEYAFKSIAKETFFQEEVTKARAELKKAVVSIYGGVLEELGCYQNVDENTDLQTFLLMVKKAVQEITSKCQ